MADTKVPSASEEPTTPRRARGHVAAPHAPCPAGADEMAWNEA